MFKTVKPIKNVKTIFQYKKELPNFNCDMI